MFEDPLGGAPDLEIAIFRQQLRRARFLATVAVREEVSGRPPSIAMSELRELRSDPVHPVDLIAFQELLLYLCHEGARLDDSPIEGVLESALQRVSTDDRGRRILAGIGHAAHATLARLPASRSLLLSDCLWTQSGWEYVRACAGLTRTYGLEHIVESSTHALNDVIEPYSAVRIVGDLRRILQRPRLGTSDRVGGIGQELGELVDELEGATTTGFGAFLMKFGNLRDHMTICLDAAPSSVPRIIQRFNSADHETLLGLRAELRTLASIVEAGVRVESGERQPHVSAPDFILPRYGVQIECTSCRLGSAVDYVKKFRQALLTKSKKSYVGRSTILTVDVTALMVVAHDSGIIYDRSELEPVTQGFLDSGSFGAVILQYTLLADGRSRDLVTRWVDSKAPTTVRAAVDAIWPLNPGVMRGSYEIPEQS